MTNEEAIEILRKNRPTSDPRPCGMELCDAVDMAISALRQQETVAKCNDLYDEDGGEVLPKNEKTNADRIRAMTDEEIAESSAFRFCPSEMIGESCAFRKCKECWLEWLQKPAGEEDKHEAD